MSRVSSRVIRGEIRAERGVLVNLGVSGIPGSA
jgi:hypothetical protein